MSTISITAGTEGTGTSWNWTSRLGESFGFLSQRERSPLGWPGGELEWEISSPVWSSSTAIGLRDLGIRVSRPTGRSSTHWAGWSPTSEGGWNRLSERGPWWPATAFAAGFSGVFYPECKLVWGAVGRHVGDSWEWKLLEPSGRRLRNSQYTCR
jgi:hypothetical protein